MKKIFTILATVLLTATLWAQSPEKMSYQAVIRNSSNALVTSTTVGMQINILQGSSSGTVVYTETQTPITNANGLVSIEIGGGAGFSTINWANDTYYIETKTDPTGGTTYTITGTSQLMSVPYALHAKTAETVTGDITETDPTFTSSEAANITATDITNLSNLSNTNTGDQDISGIATNTQAIQDTASQIRADIPTIPAGTATGDMQYWNGTAWVAVSAGTSGQLLSINASGVPEWQSPSALKTAYTIQPTVDATGIIFNGVVNANDFETTVAFEWGTDTAYGNTVAATQSPVSGTGNTTVSSSLTTGFTLGELYHVRIITTNIYGTFYGNDITFRYLYIGATYQGGLVFSIDNNLQTGLISAESDQSTTSTWNDAFTDCCGAINGYSDWRLPTKDELNLMYLNLKSNGLGSFGSAYYWSSTETNSSFAWGQYFVNGYQDDTYKLNTYYVRAIRAF